MEFEPVVADMPEFYTSPLEVFAAHLIADFNIKDAVCFEFPSLTLTLNKDSMHMQKLSFALLHEYHVLLNGPSKPMQVNVKPTTYNPDARLAVLQNMSHFRGTIAHSEFLAGTT
jgi:hypothetical protein